MEQTKALNALEPFLALSKSATSPRAASDLVMQATSAPNTYVFAELLQTPNIQNLRNSEEHAHYLTLLEIFAWGTWADYKGTFITTTPSYEAKLIHFQPAPSSPSSPPNSTKSSFSSRSSRCPTPTPPSHTPTYCTRSTCPRPAPSKN